MSTKTRNRFIGFILCILFILSFSLKASWSKSGPTLERRVLSNQLVLLVSEEHSLPAITCQVLIDGGSRRDPSGKEGLANLTAQGLLQGTVERDAAAFNRALDFMGASLVASGNKDYATLSLRILRKDLERGFALLMEALTQPLFAEEELEREVGRILAVIQAAEENPTRVAAKAFRRALFIDGPYSHPVEGTQESVSTLTRDDVVQFFRTYYHPANAIVALTGDITMEEVNEKLIPVLTKWSRGPIPEGDFTNRFARGPKTIKINREISQANIILGHTGVRRENPDYYALMVMNHILGGGGFGSRLFEEIRVKRGLAYTVRSGFEPGKSAGFFRIVLQTKNPSSSEAISICLEKMKEMQKEMVSLDELERAKKYLTGSFPLRLDTQWELASFLVQMEFYELGMDYPQKYPELIGAIRREDILRVAKTYLHPENYILVVVADLEEAGIKE